MRGWRGGAAALLVAAVLLPAPLLLKHRAAAPADEWRRADFDRALDRALADLDDEPPRCPSDSLRVRRAGRASFVSGPPPVPSSSTDARARRTISTELIGKAHPTNTTIAVEKY